MTATPSIAVGYASESGNAETLARHLTQLLHDQFQQQLPSQTPAITCLSLDDLAAQVAHADILLLISSTYGAGDIPSNGGHFLSELKAKRLQVQEKQMAVLALGDRAYDSFCQAGRDLYRLLAEQGAHVLVPLFEADTSFQPTYNQWLSRLLPRLGLAVPEKLLAFSKTYSAREPFLATLTHQHRLTSAAADKDVRHYVLNISGAGIHYQAGDSIGVMPVNSRQRVDEVLAAAGLQGNEYCRRADGHDGPVDELLSRYIELTTPGQTMLQWLAEVTGAEWLQALLHPSQVQALCQFQFTADLAEVLRRVAGQVDPLQLLARQSGLLPRYYSLSASPLSHPDELHLTVATLSYSKQGATVQGTASGWLASLPLGAKVPVFLQPSPLFRLPEDPDRDVIMIGPGTGIAPFRAFLHEREQLQAGGRNWLFFGERHRASHYLYQADLLRWQLRKELTRLDLAFSRDQEESVYVQHLLLQHAAEVFAWLENGACLYVCGDKTRMAADVDRALRQVLVEGGGMSVADAGRYLLRLRMEKRYLRDVY